MSEANDGFRSPENPARTVLAATEMRTTPPVASRRTFIGESRSGFNILKWSRSFPIGDSRVRVRQSSSGRTVAERLWARVVTVVFFA